jgi:HK97 gp10 family phage protein
LKYGFDVDASALTRNLLDLPSKVRKKVLRPALRDGAKVVLPRALARAPVGMTSTLISSIKLNANSNTAAGRKGILSVSIQTGKSDSLFSGKAFYGAFQEFGWQPGKRVGRSSRWTVRTDRHGGRVPGKHFLEGAFEERGGSARDVILAKLKAGLEREAKKG